jgi:hypothetical protein
LESWSFNQADCVMTVSIARPAQRWNLKASPAPLGADEKAIDFKNQREAYSTSKTERGFGYTPIYLRTIGFFFLLLDNAH